MSLCNVALNTPTPLLPPAPYKMGFHGDQHQHQHQAPNNHNPIEKQGILSVLDAHIDNSPNTQLSLSKNTPSLTIRRTLSADLSSPRWQHQNGLKRVHSSGRLHGDDHDQERESHGDDALGGDSPKKEGAFEDVWSSIQAEKRSWGSILSGHKDGPGSGPGLPPYVHPLVRRSTSSLSEKSLEICTESLGSETGSDGFSSYPASEPGDSDKEPEEYQLQAANNNDHIHSNNNCSDVVEEREFVEPYNNNKYHPTTSFKNRSMVLPRSSFPPPLPSLSHPDGSNLHMRSLRQDGRLVVEAVSVPSRNCFRAERHDGRLLLTLANDVIDDDDDVAGEGKDVHEEFAEAETEEEYEEEGEADRKAVVSMVTEGTSAITNRSSGMIMSKLVQLTSTRDRSAWPRRFNTAVSKAAAALPPRPRGARLMITAPPPVPAASTATAASAALNAYEYYWRRGGGDSNSSSPPRGAAVAVLKPHPGPHQQQYRHHHKDADSAGGGPQMVKDTNIDDNDNNSKKRLLAAHNEKPLFPSRRREVVLVKAAGTGLDQGVITTTTTTTTTGEKAEHLVPQLRGCKEPRRSLLFWEPYCIATS